MRGREEKSKPKLKILFGGDKIYLFHAKYCLIKNCYECAQAKLWMLGQCTADEIGFVSNNEKFGETRKEKLMLFRKIYNINLSHIRDYPIKLLMCFLLIYLTLIVFSNSVIFPLVI